MLKRMRLLFVFVCLAFVYAVVAIEGDAAPLAAINGEAEEDTLVAKLASPNKEPLWSANNVDHADPPVFPLGYDRRAQDRIGEARSGSSPAA